MTIINPHNVRQLYFTWSVLLVAAVGLTVGSYYLRLHPQIPAIAELPDGILYSLLVYAGLAWVLGLLFKYSFRRPMIAWGLFVSIGFVAVALTVMLGWNVFSLVLHAVAALSLLCFGPYLHFE